jgi:membrane protein implicated in regulation of membrane protease activity
VAAYLPTRSPSMEWTIATSVSISISIIVSVTMLSLSAWHPVGAFFALAVFTAAVLVHQLLRERAGERPGEDRDAEARR